MMWMRATVDVDRPYGRKPLSPWTCDGGNWRRRHCNRRRGEDAVILCVRYFWLLFFRAAGMYPAVHM